MRKKTVVSMAVVMLLLIGIMATSVLASNLTSVNATVSKDLQAASNAETQISVPVRNLSPASIRPYDNSASVTADDSVTSIVPNEPEEVDVDSLREAVPSTYEETDTRMSTQRTRFLLYTHDGKHIMWGFVGNGYFVGTDNLGKRCWGIYGKGVFAGFYDGGFFWGKYRSGNWKAEGLFGMNYSHGKYVLFPAITLESIITASRP